ncbi:MAG: hypothetical protein WCT37_04280 [Patescibacteria group bacterium]|jgi:hypothetical protein
MSTDKILDAKSGKGFGVSYTPASLKRQAGKSLLPGGALHSSGLGQEELNLVIGKVEKRLRALPTGADQLNRIQARELKEEVQRMIGTRLPSGKVFTYYDAKAAKRLIDSRF